MVLRRSIHSEYLFIGNAGEATPQGLMKKISDHFERNVCDFDDGSKNSQEPGASQNFFVTYKARIMSDSDPIDLSLRAEFMWGVAQNHIPFGYETHLDYYDGVNKGDLLNIERALGNAGFKSR